MALRRRIAVALLAVAAVAAPSTAQAAAVNSAAPAPVPATDTVEAPMYIDSFDAAVADANGYELREDAQGRLVTVKKGAPIETGTVLPPNLPGTGQVSVPGTISPMGVVAGNCGTSFLYITNPSTLTFKVRNGFSVNSPAISYSWASTATGPGYAYTKKDSGALALRSSWVNEWSRTISANQRGSYFASANGIATLANGTKCVSAIPTDISDIF